MERGHREFDSNRGRVTSATQSSSGTPCLFRKWKSNARRVPIQRCGIERIPAEQSCGSTHLVLRWCQKELAHELERYKAHAARGRREGGGI
jgi:hypothetical protein